VISQDGYLCNQGHILNHHGKIMRYHVHILWHQDGSCLTFGGHLGLGLGLGVVGLGMPLMGHYSYQVHLPTQPEELTRLQTHINNGFTEESILNRFIARSGKISP
jgi:hypothetical protein